VVWDDARETARADQTHSPLIQWSKALRFRENPALNSMRLPLLQINPTASDLDGNSALIVHGARTARAQGADLMVTSELALMDYRPRDLLMNQGSVYRAGEKLSHIVGELKDARRC
jgi:hypothetical protein